VGAGEVVGSRVVGDFVGTGDDVGSVFPHPATKRSREG